jgi:hypothetical protein
LNLLIKNYSHELLHTNIPGKYRWKRAGS